MSELYIIDSMSNADFVYLLENDALHSKRWFHGEKLNHWALKSILSWPMYVSRVHVTFYPQTSANGEAPTLDGPSHCHHFETWLPTS